MKAEITEAPVTNSNVKPAIIIYWMDGNQQNFQAAELDPDRPTQEQILEVAQKYAHLGALEASTVFVHWYFSMFSSYSGSDFVTQWFVKNGVAREYNSDVVERIKES